MRECLYLDRFYFATTPRFLPENTSVRISQSLTPMKNTSSAPVKPQSKPSEIIGKMAAAQKLADVAKKKAQEAKAVLKRARKTHKLAKKAAKAARGEVKGLKKTLEALKRSATRKKTAKAKKSAAIRKPVRVKPAATQPAVETSAVNPEVVVASARASEQV